jgi:hypothetical protein
MLTTNIKRRKTHRDIEKVVCSIILAPFVTAAGIMAVILLLAMICVDEIKRSIYAKLNCIRHKISQKWLEEIK